MQSGNTAPARQAFHSRLCLNHGNRIVRTFRLKNSLTQRVQHHAAVRA
ncbi:hypothetical protein Z945_1656 [Sulfitobacter noctilucae]|nr:hypothetical protein Z945_1656 [Sulfitobacter noctilucae]